MVRVLWLVVGSPIECLAPVRRSFAESDHGLVHRGEEMISTQLLQERTVFQVVVHQFGCPGALTGSGLPSTSWPIRTRK